MKKLFAILAIAGIMVSCGNKKKADKKTETDTTVTTNNNTNNNGTTTTTVSGVPTFSDPEVQQYANDLTVFVNSYLDAVRGKNMARMAELAPKWADWSTRSMTVAQKLSANPDEAKKWSDYWEKISKDWEEAAKAMVPNMQ